MKAGKRTISLLLAMVLVFSAAPEAFAWTYDVGSAEEMVNSWNVSANDFSGNNVFNMTDNIDMGGQTLVADSSEDYTINGNGYTLTDVSIAAKTDTTTESAQPDVTINANVNSSSSQSGSAALEVSGTVDVVVNGNINVSDDDVAVITNGGSDVTVNGNVTANGDGTAVLAANTSKLTVTGSVTASENNAAIDARDSANVTVNKNVTSIDGPGVSASDDATVTVKGTVTSNGDGDAITAEGDATVTVKNVVSNNSSSTAVSADGATVSVTGNVTSNAGGTSVAAINGAQVTANNVTHNGDGVAVTSQNGSKVTVNGDVTLQVSNNSSSTAIVAQNGTVIVGDDVKSDMNGIQAIGDKASVTVKGDVDVFDSGLDPSMTRGIIAGQGANVTINGDVYSHGDSYITGIGGNGSGAITNTKQSSVTIKGDYTSNESGLHVNNGKLVIHGDVNVNDQTVIQNKSDVKIYGDFTGLPATGVTQDGGVYVIDGSDLYMGNGTTLETDQLHISNNSDVDAAFIKANAVTVGVISGSEDDKSTLDSASISADHGNAVLTTGGSSSSIVRGTAETISARDKSRVEVYGSADQVDVYDDAVVITNTATNVVTHMAEPSSSFNYAVGTTTANDIIKLCVSFNYGSGTMFQQWEDMGDLLTVASVNISEKLDLPGAALKTALFDHENINLDAYMSNRFTDLDLYDSSTFNKTSVENFKNADKLSPYLINKYKDTLATAMADLSQSQNSQTNSELNECLANLAMCSGKVMELYEYFNAEESAFLEDLMLDGSLSKADVVEFLRAFRFEPEDHDIMLAAQRFEDMAGMVDTIASSAETVAKIAKTGMTIYDILQPLFRDYSLNVGYLDYMLATQPLDAELFAAAAELRVQLNNKALAVANETVDKIKSWSVGAIKDMWAPLKAGQAVIDVIGFVTGSTKYATDTQNGAALCCMASEIYNVFEDSILAVKAGDTSDDAVQMVYTSYTVLKNTLEEMCKVMETLGNKKEKETYKAILTKLKSMDLGEYVELAEYNG